MGSLSLLSPLSLSLSPNPPYHNQSLSSSNTSEVSIKPVDAISPAETSSSSFSEFSHSEHPPLGNPHFSNLPESSSPTFLGVSTNMIDPIKVFLRKGARGTGAISKNYILIIVLTKLITYKFMKNCERQNINLGISTHIANYKSP